MLKTIWPLGENQRFVGWGTGHDVFTYPKREEVLAATEEQLARVPAPGSGNDATMQPAEG